MPSADTLEDTVHACMVCYCMISSCSIALKFQYRKAAQLPIDTKGRALQNPQHPEIAVAIAIRSNAKGPGQNIAMPVVVKVVATNTAALGGLGNVHHGSRKLQTFIL